MNCPSILEEIHRQGLQVHERGHAGAEVIECELAAAPLELAHQIAGVGEARHRRGLGDLEAQRAGDRRLPDGVQDKVHERLLVERGAGEIHRQNRQGLAAALALPEQLDRLSHDQRSSTDMTL